MEKYEKLDSASPLWETSLLQYFILCLDIRVKINRMLTGLRQRVGFLLLGFVLWSCAATSVIAYDTATSRLSGADAASVQKALQSNPVMGQGALSAIQKNPALMQSLATAFKENPKAAESLNRTLQNNPQLRQQLNAALQNTSQTTASSASVANDNTAAVTTPLPSKVVHGYAQNASSYGPKANTTVVSTTGTAATTASSSHEPNNEPTSEANTPFAGTGWDKTSSEQKAYQSAFRQVTAQAFPLKPDEILRLHRLLDATEAAVSMHPKPPPKPVSASVVVSTAPGSSPPIIRLSKGYVSSLVFLDSSGAPWPIKAYDLGDPRAFNIAWDRKSNTLMVQAMEGYAYGNIAINLRGMNTPVTLTFITGQPVVDYRVDLRVTGRGPMAKPDLNSLEMPDQADSLLLGVLDGIAPEGSTLLKTKTHGVQVWCYKNVMYVRTQYNLLSPAWLAKMSSADGTHAYKLQKASSLLVARHGNVSPIKIEGL
ncbi:MAG: DotH/IcmK family type IV secretion protein [Gammaproteobacteria bacterium]